jgi:hypothetical protein
VWQRIEPKLRARSCSKILNQCFFAMKSDCSSNSIVLT